MRFSFRFLFIPLIAVLALGATGPTRPGIRLPQPESTTGDISFADVAVSSTASGWPATNLIDGNVSTRWSSKQYTDASHTEWAAAWFDTNHSVYKSLNYIKLYPRYSNGTSLAFPIDFNIQYSNGSQWITLQTYTAFAKPHADWIILPFGKTVTTNGLRINATKLGQDDFNYYYFQLGEMMGGYDIGFETLQFMGMDGPSGFNQFDNVDPDGFNPNKIKNWNYDYRLPLITSTCTKSRRNIYASKVEWNAPTEQWYIYYGGNDTTPDAPECNTINDQIYWMPTDKNFQTIDHNTQKLIITNGSFENANNPALTRGPDGSFNMVYTLGWDNPNADWDYNRPGYATSSDGKTWTPNSGGDPNGSNTLITMANYHGGDWANAYINNQNALLYDRGYYWYYWGPEGLGGSDFRGYSTNMKNFTEEGVAVQSSRHSANDLKKFRWNGQEYYMLLGQQGEPKIYYTLATDPANISSADAVLFETSGTGDDWISDAGLVTDGTTLYGALYGGHPSDTNYDDSDPFMAAVYAIWLQKKVLFTFGSTTWGTTERADGPHHLRLGLASTSSVETGVVTIYDTDGTTLLYTSPPVTLASKMHWKVNVVAPNDQPCEPPSSGDWNITQNCIWNTTIRVPGNLYIKNNAQVRVTSRGFLDVDLQNRSITIENGSRLDIDQGGVIQ